MVLCRYTVLSGTGQLTPSLLMLDRGSGQPCTGPDTRTCGFGPVQTQVREGQDRTPDSLRQPHVFI